MRIVTTSDGSKTLFSDRYQQTYHSIHGALTETQVIFLESSALENRLIASKQTDTQLQILEIGFGLGLNFLLSADAAHRCDSGIEYTATENDPVTPSLLKELDYRSLLSSPQLADRLLESLDDGALTDQFAVSGNVTLKLFETLDQALADADTAFDIVYLDAFSPDTNPECWARDVLESIYSRTAENGVLVTYSARGKLRRDMIDIGFTVTRLPGPPGKREFLKAIKPSVADS